MRTRIGSVVAGLAAFFLFAVAVAQTDAPPADPLAGKLTLADGAGSRVRLGGILQLEKQDSYEMSVDIAVGVGKTPQRLVDAADKATLYVAEEKWIYTVVITAVLILLAAFIVPILCSRMLRDEQTGLYSPGKSQMAFWGLLVVLTFLGVWILTGTMERIPAQALILLGISAGTGLSAILIGRDDQARRAAARLERTSASKPPRASSRRTQHESPAYAAGASRPTALHLPWIRLS